MKTLAAVLLLVGVLFLPGCTYVPGVEPTDLPAVHEGTATRTEIEAVLGEPLESRDTNEGSINIYLYDRGAEGGFEAPLGAPGGCGGGGCELLLLALPFVWASTPFLYADKVDEQEGYLIVAYSADGTVSYYGTGRNIDRVVQQLQRAVQGDPEAQWQLGAFPGPQRELWLCRAAHSGHADAQFSLGTRY